MNVQHGIASITPLSSAGTLAALLFSSSHMRVMNHNWSATKQCLHLQSVDKISRHSVLSGRQVETIESIDVKAVNMLMLFYNYVKLVSVNTCMKHIFCKKMVAKIHGN